MRTIKVMGYLPESLEWSNVASFVSGISPITLGVCCQYLEHKPLERMTIQVCIQQFYNLIPICNVVKISLGTRRP